ncbi:tetratricopeptide repeat protein [Treponema sp. UBA3813]|uniref:tetratricopeptide repeat protein n=1 Tax=Treponema sp. UBA3813 TaxID=1947715 RepID=UPI0025CE7D90|nr:tetratricopeptide repeat protein [Treponema sp. UBA3813]
MKRIWFLISVILLCFFSNIAYSQTFPFASIQLPDEEKKILEDVSSLLEKGEYEKAKEKFDFWENNKDSVYSRALKEFSVNAENLLQELPALKEGRNLYDSKEYRKSLRFADRFLKKQPDYYAALVLRCMNLVKLKPNQAITECNKILYYFPFNYHILAIRGDAFLELGTYDEAKKNYNLSLRIKPNALAYESRGKIYYKVGEFDKALGDYNESIRLNPKNTNESYLYRAAVYWLGQENEKAFSDCETYFSGGGKAAWGKKILASLYMRKNDFKNALKYCDEYIEANPKSSDSYYMRGGVYYVFDDYKKALKDFDKAIKLNPKSPLAYAGRSDVYRELGDTKKALENADSALKYSKTALEFYTAYMSRGKIHLELNEKALALSDFQNASQYANSDVLADLIKKAKEM